MRTKRPAIVSQKFDYWSVGWNSDGSKIVGAREDSRKTVDVLEIVDARTLEPEQSECVTEGSCVFSLAWHPTVPDHFYSVTHKSSSMLPFITNIEMHQVTASGIVRRCTMPAHPEPCSYIDIQCDRLGKHMLTVSRDKDKDSDDRTDDCVIAIWDMETLVVLANIMDPDDYKNLTCSIQPKGGLIAVGGLSDIKVCTTAFVLALATTKFLTSFLLLRFTIRRHPSRCGLIRVFQESNDLSLQLRGRRRRSRCWLTHARMPGTGTRIFVLRAGNCWM